MADIRIAGIDADRGRLAVCCAGGPAIQRALCSGPGGRAAGEPGVGCQTGDVYPVGPGRSDGKQGASGRTSAERRHNQRLARGHTWLQGAGRRCLPQVLPGSIFEARRSGKWTRAWMVGASFSDRYTTIRFTPFSARHSRRLLRCLRSPPRPTSRLRTRPLFWRRWRRRSGTAPAPRRRCSCSSTGRRCSATSARRPSSSAASSSRASRLWPSTGCWRLATRACRWC